MITGAKDAAVAFHSMERLRQQEKPGVVARAKKPFPSSTEGETVGNLCEIGPEIVRINHPEDQSRIEAPGQASLVPASNSERQVIVLRAIATSQIRLETVNLWSQTM